MTAFRKMLGMPGMLRSIHKIFLKIRDPKTFATPTDISITDHLMSGLAVFGLKCPSLLYYDKKRANDVIAQNLRDLYLVSNSPSDTYLREHPHLKAILTGDGLTSNAPYIRMIDSFRLKYILGAKPGDHEFLFEQLESSGESVYHEIRTDDGSYHQFRFLNGVSLNKSNLDVIVNVLEYRQTDRKGKETSFSWVTNIEITQNNAFKIMRGGRARWKIENETFNTLKNLGYNFEHNYGHGKKYLSTVFGMLMMLAFLLDQVQELCCILYKRCRTHLRTYRDLWEHMRVLFRRFILGDWESFYLMLLEEKELNTS